MNDETTVIEQPPICIKCTEPIPECSLVYYGGDMGERENDTAPRKVLQVWWCMKCFTELYKKILGDF